jgi:hypothetical protein
MDLRQPQLILALRSCAIAVAVCLAVAPLGMSCCASFSCSSSQPNNNSELPCHGASGSHSHYETSATANHVACHAGEFTLTAQEIRSYGAGQTIVSNSVAPLLRASIFAFSVQSFALSPHPHQESPQNAPLRI